MSSTVVELGRRFGQRQWGPRWKRGHLQKPNGIGHYTEVETWPGEWACPKRPSSRSRAACRALDETRASRWNNLRLLTCRERRNCPCNDSSSADRQTLGVPH